ncbi:MAG: hypothetical protein D9N11_11360 [Ketobacter sp.]|nr:MAG: hypothetical protein D9N11_11360 [Ketobacter sp.]
MTNGVSPVNSNQARSDILRKLAGRRSPEPTPSPSPNEPVAIQFSSADEFSANIANNGALVTFASAPKKALQAAKQLCMDNEWRQPPVVCPALQTLCRKLRLWDWESEREREWEWEWESSDARPTGTVAITQAFCGIADTGTVLCLSSPGNPTSLNFLPEHHIVLLEKKQIVAGKQDAWRLLRNAALDTPRAINLISGPSRTADIEQTIQLGAHGPRSLTVIIVG